MKKKFTPFFVKSDRFSLLKAFKEEAEKLGYVYNKLFTEFAEETHPPTSGLYFSTGFKGYADTPAFSLSNCSKNVYVLPQQFDEALAHAKQTIDEFNKRSRLVSLICGGYAEVKEDRLLITPPDSRQPMEIAVKDMVAILDAANKTGLWDMIDNATEVHIDKW